MTNRQRTISIALATLVLLGGLIEVMKSSQSATSMQATRNSGLFGIHLENESSPELFDRPAREAAIRARSRLSGRLTGKELKDRLGGNTSDDTRDKTTDSTTDILAADGPSPTLADPKKVNTTDAAKKKAEEDKKKKKKKKKSDKAKKSAQEPAVDVSVVEKDKGDSKADPAPLGGGAVNVQTAIAAKAAAAAATKETEEADGELSSLEDWIAFIMPQPNYERTMKMVQELQAKRLEPSIFHDVATEMLADPRPKMQELAIVALGSYPSLRSYLMLHSANLRFTESSPMKVHSRNYLKAYSRVENLRYLASVLTARVDTDAVYEALRLIDTSVGIYSGRTNSGQPNSTSGNSGSTSATTNVASSNVIRQFQPLVAVLNLLSQTSSDEVIRQQASTTLRQVQAITGS